MPKLSPAARRVLVLLAVVVVTVFVMKGVAYVQRLQQAAADVQLDAAAQHGLNDSTVVRLASTVAERDSLATALADAKALNGKLIAAVKIRVPRRDTVVVHDTLPTQTDSSGTRTATFRDSTFAGVVVGTVTAPPAPAPLGVRYDLIRPEFKPTVALVEVGERRAFVVTWHGERAEIEAPYAAAPPPPHKVLGWYVNLRYNPIAQRVAGGFGGRLSPGRSTDLQVGVDTRDALYVGIQQRF